MGTGSERDRLERRDGRLTEFREDNGMGLASIFVVVALPVLLVTLIMAGYR